MRFAADYSGQHCRLQWTALLTIVGNIADYSG